MKKFLLSIFAVLFAFAGAQAEEYTYTFSAKQFTANGTKTLDNVDWTLAGDGGYWGYDGTKGQQFGSGSLPYKSMTFSTSGISGTITKIVVNTSGASSVNASFTVSVGGTQYGSSTKLTTSATDYTFTGSASGDIVLSYTQSSSKAIYIKSISVTYETGEGGGETPEPEEPVVPEEPETPEDGIVWNLVEDVNDIETGDEVIIAATTQDVALGVLSGTYHTSTSVIVSEKKLTDTGDAIVLTVGKSGDNYTFSYNNNYLNYEGSKNTLTTTGTVGSTSSWTIAITDGVATISNVGNSGRMLQYNSSSPRFACYLASSKQQNVRIYKKTELLSHTLTVTDAGWATLYLATTARIPSDVEAYTVTAVNSGWVTLTQVTGVIPANTGIIVKADAEDYKFFMGETATADVTGNLLEGTLFNRNINEEAYVLGEVGDVVGLYKAQMTDGVWLNNANKAYLPASALTPAQQTAAFYGFDWDGTTGIDEVKGESGNVKAIYDLTGRRVEAITAPGIYVVGGKKVLVK